MAHNGPSSSSSTSTSNGNNAGPLGWFRTAHARLVQRLNQKHAARSLSHAARHASSERTFLRALSAPASRHTTSSSAAWQQDEPSGTGRHSHLIVLVNGLYGSPGNWAVVCSQLRKRLNMEETILHPSNVNNKTATYDGIDVCGQRLADEVRSVVAANAHLERISFITHSMGGLLARYALGVLFNPVEKTVCGLRPCHFVSMATPHMGCDAEGIAQIPFIGWTGEVPLVGQPLLKLMAAIATPTAQLLFRRTGQQFFLADGRQDSGDTTTGTPDTGGAGVAGAGTAAQQRAAPTSNPPLLVAMTQDVPEKGQYFYSALSAFATRTAYANCDGDHLVGWANSSMRTLSSLPPLPPEVMAKAKGVVRSDELSEAFYEHQWEHLRRGAAGGASTGAAGADSGAGGSGRHGARGSEQWRPLGSGDGADASSSSRDGSSGADGDSAGALGSSSSALGSAAEQQQALVAAERAALEQGMEELAQAQEEAAADEEVPALGRQAQASGSGRQLHLASRRQQEQQGSTGLQGSSPKAVQGGSPKAALPAGAPANGASPKGGSPKGGSPKAGLSWSVGSDFATHNTTLVRASSNASSSSSGNGSSLRRASTAAADAEADLEEGLSQGSASPAGNAEEARAAAHASQQQEQAELQPSNSGKGGAAGGNVPSRAAEVTAMLHRLQQLPWRRIDVSFKGASFGFAHNNIQVTRRWMNWEGHDVVKHLAQQIQAMDQLVMAQQAPAAQPTEARQEPQAPASVSQPAAAEQPVALQ